MLWMIIPMLPLLCLLPGDLGDLFRQIRAFVGACVVIFLLTLVWSGALMYQGSKCWLGGDILACERGYGLWDLPAEPFKLVYGVFHSTPELQAAHAREMQEWQMKKAQEQAMTSEQREHSHNQSLLNDYNKRNGTNYILTPDNKVVKAEVRVMPSAEHQYALELYNIEHHTNYGFAADGKTWVEKPRVSWN